MGVHRLDSNKVQRSRAADPAADSATSGAGTAKGPAEVLPFPFTEMLTVAGFRVPTQWQAHPQLAQLRQNAEHTAGLDLSSFPPEIQEDIRTMLEFAESPTFKRQMQALLDIDVPDNDSA